MKKEIYIRVSVSKQIITLQNVLSQMFSGESSPLSVYQYTQQTWKIHASFVFDGEGSPSGKWGYASHSWLEEMIRLFLLTSNTLGKYYSFGRWCKPIVLGISSSLNFNIILKLMGKPIKQAVTWTGKSQVQMDIRTFKWTVCSLIQ